jgi:hypothetical protein
LATVTGIDVDEDELDPEPVEEGLFDEVPEPAAAVELVSC